MSFIRTCLVICLLSLSGLAAAQSPDSNEAIEQRLTVLENQINSATTELSTDVPVSRVTELRSRLLDAKIELTEINRKAAEEKKRAEDEQAQLGEKTGDESSLKNDRRFALANRLNAAESQETLSTILIQQVNQLQEETTISLREAFMARTFKRSPPAYQPSSLSAAGSELSTRTQTVSNTVGAWITAQRSSNNLTGSLLALGAALIFLISSLFFFRDWLAQRVWDQSEGEDITHAYRSATAFLRAFSRIVLAALALLITYRVLLQTELVTAPAIPDVRALFAAVFFVVVAHAVLLAILAPKRSAWRLVRLNDSDALRRYRRLMIPVVLFAGYSALVAIAPHPDTGEHRLVDLLTLVASLGFAVWLILFSTRRKSSIARILLVALAAVMIAAALMGYTALNRLLIQRIAYFSIFLCGLYLVREFLRDWASLAVERIVFGETRLDEKGTDDAVTFWTQAAVDGLLIFFATPVALSLAGVEWTEISSIFRATLNGFSIGSFTISPLKMLYALLVIVAVLVGTRLIQRLLDSRILPMAGVNQGLRHSFRTLAGYAGLVVAFFAGVSTLGFDLSSLTIIAGALSVGIGFGLQSIVNNFVSGLILLLERPIKIGDWVVTNSGEGRVQRINVRSTEIETFDKCSIIVPNSELISSTVQNWTYKDRAARIKIAVGVSYDTDPNHARDVLLTALEDVPEVLKYPEPYVYFANFGDSSLDLELRAFVRDADRLIRLRSELRYKVFDVLKKAGIEIPFPQRDLNVKSVSALSAALITNESEPPARRDDPAKSTYKDGTDAVNIEIDGDAD